MNKLQAGDEVTVTLRGRVAEVMDGGVYIKWEWPMQYSSIYTHDVIERFSLKVIGSRLRGKDSNLLEGSNHEDTVTTGSTSTPQEK